MTDIASLSHLIENLIRLGTVAEVDHGSLPDKRPARVLVQSGELLTGWLPWTALRAGTTRDWDPRTVGGLAAGPEPQRPDRPGHRHARPI